MMEYWNGVLDSRARHCEDGCSCFTQSAIRIPHSAINLAFPVCFHPPTPRNEEPQSNCAIGQHIHRRRWRTEEIADVDHGKRGYEQPEPNGPLLVFGLRYACVDCDPCGKHSEFHDDRRRQRIPESQAVFYIHSRCKQKIWTM